MSGTLETKQIEQRTDTPKTKDSNKTLYDLVVAQGYNFKRIVPYLAESFKVCTKEEYKRAVTNPNKEKNIKYNLAIREKLLSGEKIVPPDLKQEEIVNKFDVKKQDIINKQFGLSSKYPGFVAYINGLKETQIQKLNTMSESDFQSFLSQQAAESQKISVTSELAISKFSIEQIQNIALLQKFKQRFSTFKQNNNLEQVASSKEKDVDEAYDRLSPEAKKRYLQALGTEENVKEKLRYDLDNKLLYASEEFKRLNSDKQKEFNQMIGEYAAYNSSIGLGDELKNIWGEEMYASTQKISIAKEEKGSSIDMMKNEIVSDRNIMEYFQEHTPKTLVQESDKDKKYYTNLQKLYPEIDKDPELQQLKKEGKKEELEKKIQEKSTPAEKRLLAETDAVVQEQAVTSCIDMLKMYMDIDLSTQENVLEQFTLLHQNDLIRKDGEDVVVDINGTINGKKLKLYYNLSKGTLQQEEFLSRDGINSPFSINDPVGGKKEVIGIQLSKLQDFIVGAGKIDYKNVIDASRDVKAYKGNVASELKKIVTKEGAFTVSIEKNIFEKTVVQNILAQEIFSFMGKDKDIPAETFSRENNADIYDMYTLIDNTLHYHTIDELKTLRNIIPILKNQKERYVTNITEKNNNTERYLLGLLGNQNVILDQKAQNVTNEYSLLNNYASFFSIFKTMEANIPIIDLNICEKFAKKSEDVVSNDQSYLDDSESKLNFKKAMSQMEDISDIADLETSIKNLPEQKKSV